MRMPYLSRAIAEPVLEELAASQVCRTPAYPVAAGYIALSAGTLCVYRYRRGQHPNPRGIDHRLYLIGSGFSTESTGYAIGPGSDGTHASIADHSVHAPWRMDSARAAAADDRQGGPCASISRNLASRCGAARRHFPRGPGVGPGRSFDRVSAESAPEAGLRTYGLAAPRRERITAHCNNLVGSPP